MCAIGDSYHISVTATVQIPVAMVTDALLRNTRYNAVYVSGALLVVLGFVLVTLAERLGALLRPPVQRYCPRCVRFV